MISKNIPWVFPLLFCLLVILPASPGCRREHGNAPGEPANAIQKFQEAQDGQPSTDATVEDCREAYAALFGEEGCRPGIMTPEQILAACTSYAAWKDGGDECGAGAFQAFFQCLKAIDCKVFEEETGFREEYGNCQVQFAKDMDLCIHN